MNALRLLDINQGELQNTIGRLGSGLRINSAADDPAGLIISEGMRAQIKGLEQAIRNSQDAVNMAKTAEGALDEVQRLLRDIRGLAVHSANTAVVDAPSLQANQTQIRSTLQSISRIAEQTSFGSKRLLDGTAGVLANITAVDYLSSLYVGGTFAGQGVVSGPVTLSRVTPAVLASVALGGTFPTADSLVTGSGAFVINGYSFTTDGNETVASVVAKINAMSSITGVSAQITGAGPVSILLRQNTYGAQHSITFFDPTNILHDSASATSSGVNGVYNVTLTTTAGVTTVPFTGGLGPNESGLTLRDNYGNVLSLTENGNATIGAAATLVGAVTAGNVHFQIGANAHQAVQFSLPVVHPNRLGTGVFPNTTLADIDITSQQGATRAIQIIDKAIEQLAQMRGDLGSFQKNFLESTVRSLGIAQENLVSTESTIRDADMAAEITKMTRLQILQQSGMSVLAQANQIPQNVLSLLRNG